jgi:hypothetical protein
VPLRDDTFCNISNLRGCLALAEDHFRRSLAQDAMVIDSCKAEVFERSVPKCGSEPFLGRVERQ